MAELGTVTFFIIYEDGSVETQTLPDEPGAEPVLSKPGRNAGEIEYNQFLARIEQQNALWFTETQAREQQLLKADYDALIAAGIPEATARRITGYSGP